VNGETASQQLPHAIQSQRLPREAQTFEEPWFSSEFDTDPDNAPNDPR